MRNMLHEIAGLEYGAVPIDTTGAAVTGDRVNLQKYGHVTVIIMQGAWAGGTPAVTLKQHTAATGGTTTALGFTDYWSQVGLTGTGYSKTTVSSDTFDLTATANTITVIEVSAASLTTDSPWFSCNIASPDANTDLICVFYVLRQARYAQAAVPDPKA